MNKVYVIDANALINAAHQYNMAKSTFFPVWEKINSMVESGNLITSVEIKDKLKDEDIDNWAKHHSDIFMPLTEEVQRETVEVLKKYPTLIQIKSSGNSNGDPFLIATALLYNGIVVTDEKLGDTKNQKAYKIPNVCNELNIEWMGLRNFIEEIID